MKEDGTQKVRYYYDSTNQLVRENNVWQNKTIKYAYDKGGNIQTVKEYALTNGPVDDLPPVSTVTYSYEDNNWKDKLTSYNGHTIAYDAIGNPTTYYNGTTFTWQNGRELAGLTTSNNTAVSYKYNSDGIRTSKKVGSVTTSYTLEGSNVVYETNGTDKLWYYYDASGMPVSFELNGTSYHYVKNLQGDIIAIVNDSGAKVVEYKYDSWGKLISTTGSLASTVGIKNPYRYRGYRYDNETGLYYLQSRYYDPQIGRFINADSVDYLDASGTVLGCNLFAYCENNPVNEIDPDGRIAASKIIDVIMAVSAQYIGDVINNIISGKSGMKIFIPCSSILTYIISATSALVQFNSWKMILGKAVIANAIKSIENILRKKVNWKKEILSFVKGVVVDFAIEMITIQIGKLSPKNYSTFAHKLRSKNAKNQSLSKNQIKLLMRKKIQNVNRCSTLFNYVSSVLSAVF